MRRAPQVLDASFVASEVEQWKAFAPLVTEEAFRRGLDCTEEIEFIGDGAEGIWSLQEMVFPYAKTRLDLYHARKKISHRTGQAYKNNPAKAKHREALTKHLESGEGRRSGELYQQTQSAQRVEERSGAQADQLSEKASAATSPTMSRSKPKAGPSAAG